MSLNLTNAEHQYFIENKQDIYFEMVKAKFSHKNSFISLLVLFKKYPTM